VAAVAAVVVVVVAAGLLGGGPTARASTGPSPTIRTVAPSAAAGPTASTGTFVPSGTSPTSTTPPAAEAAIPAPAAAPPSTAEAQPPIASSVARAEAAGIDPGAGWSWSIGDPTTACGAIAGAGVATGCTSWSNGVETTVFAGAPSLALVAHEVANAETERDALPGLLGQVAAAAGTTSWSPTDAVASCLVVHALGFQDGAAGSWQCPSALASIVAEHIHDTVTTTQTTAVCGTASGVSSTLVFTADSGTLSVTGPGGAAPVTAPAGTPVTVSGIGTFTAVDEGGAATEVGACQA
jgi:hypothetical protein